jgi:VWFA-related protein
MKNKLNKYLMMVLYICFVLLGVSIFATAQSFDYSPNGVKDFGSSLKKTDKKKKDRAKITKQNNHTATANEDDVIRIDTVLVANEVLVFDKNGNQVRGLRKEDFIVEEDGRPQVISTFLSGDSELIPRSIVLIIDHSFSQLPYIETSVEAAKVLVDKLNPNDRMAIVTDKVELLQGFTSDKNLLKDRLESLKNAALSGQTGQSRQYSALMATLNEMFDDNGLRPIIIFQTDGDELSHLKGEAANFLFLGDGPRKFSYKDILTATEKTRATIYTIVSGIRLNGISDKEKLIRAKTDLVNSERAFAKLRNIAYTPDKQKVSERFLESRAKRLSHQQEAIAEIARFTGGSTNYLEQPEQAEKIYSEILSKMNLRYVVGYYPANQVRDGKRREVITKVRGHPEYKILGRKTYILAENE